MRTVSAGMAHDAHGVLTQSAAELQYLTCRDAGKAHRGAGEGVLKSMAGSILTPP